MRPDGVKRALAGRRARPRHDRACHRARHPVPRVLVDLRPAGDILQNTVLASGFFLGTWLVMLAFFGAYERDVFGAGTEEFKLVVNASFFTGALVATMAFLMQFPLLARLSSSCCSRSAC